MKKITIKIEWHDCWWSWVSLKVAIVVCNLCNSYKKNRNLTTPTCPTHAISWRYSCDKLNDTPHVDDLGEDVGVGIVQCELNAILELRTYCQWICSDHWPGAINSFMISLRSHGPTVRFSHAASGACVTNDSLMTMHGTASASSKAKFHDSSSILIPREVANFYVTY